MGVKERIIAFKLLEQKENHLAFLEEIGVAVELKKIEGDIVQNKKQCIFFVKICNSFFASCRFYVILQTVNHGGICASILIEFSIFILLYYQRRAETYEHYFKSESKNSSFTR